MATDGPYKTTYTRWNPTDNDWDEFLLSSSADLIAETDDYKVMTLAERTAISDLLTDPQGANKVLASPNEATGVPFYRALVAEDIPSLIEYSFGVRIDDTVRLRFGRDDYAFMKPIIDGYQRAIGIYSQYQTDTTLIASFGGSVLNMNSHKIKELADPNEAQDAATKKYVDDLVSTGTRPASDTVKAATTSQQVDIPLEDNDSMDSISVDDGDRVLVKNQTDDTENGVYLVVNPGSWIKQTEDSEEGILVFIEEGATQNDYLYYNTDGDNWVPFSKVDTIGIIDGGGLEKVGTDLGIKNGGVNNGMLAGSIAWSKLVSPQLEDDLSWTGISSHVDLSDAPLENTVEALLSSVKLIRGTDSYNENNDQNIRELYRSAISEAGCIGDVLATDDVTTLSGTGTTIEGHTIATGDLVILTGQTSSSEDGIYVVNGSGEAWSKIADLFRHAHYMGKDGDNADKYYFISAVGSRQLLYETPADYPDGLSMFSLV